MTVNEQLYNLYKNIDLITLKELSFVEISRGTQLNLFEDLMFTYWNFNEFEKMLKFEFFNNWIKTLSIIHIHYWTHKIPELGFEQFEQFLNTPEKRNEIIDKILNHNYQAMIQKVNDTNIIIFIDNGRFKQR